MTSALRDVCGPDNDLLGRNTIVSPVTHARRQGLRLLAVLLSFGLIFALVTVPRAETAFAAPLKGKLCRDLFGLPAPTNPRTTEPTAAELAALGQLPLDYENPAEYVRNAKLPSDDPEKMIEDWGTDYDKKVGKKKKYPVGTPEHLFKRWNAYLIKHRAEIPDPNAYFPKWRAEYVTVHDNNARGHAFHKLVVEKLGLTGDDWLCEKTIGRTGERVRVDIIHRNTRFSIEVKAGSGYTADQLRKYEVNIRNGNLARTMYVHAQTPDQAARKALQNASNATGNKVISAQLPSTPHRTNSVLTRGDVALAPKPGGSVSAVGDNALRSGRNAVEARQQQNAARELGARDHAFRRPGGIDWSTLQLNYLEMDPGSGDVGYAFDAAENPDEVENPSFGGAEALDLTSDAFFTWLALPDQVFWVNLNPDQPDLITDPSFADTKAARVLLEADLEMKRDYTALVNPETETGAAYWDSLRTNPDGSVCWPGSRQWITAAPAQVRQEGDRLYILDAPLKVNKERMDFTNLPPGYEPCEASDETMEHNFRMLQEHVTPVVEELVNTDPKYADLRRVYRARVAAAWVKQRNVASPGPYDAIIDSGDVSRWPEGTDWEARDVWDDMLEDWNEVQFEVTRKEIVNGEEWTWTYPIYGGVEWDKAPKRQTPTAQFRREHPELPKTVQESKVDPVAYGEADVFLGGGTAQAPDEPDPSPSPTPSAPPAPAPDPKDPDPDLVATG